MQVGPILKRKHRHQRDHCEIAVDKASGMRSVLRIITIGMGQQRGERLRLRQRRQPRTFDLIILSQQEDRGKNEVGRLEVNGRGWDLTGIAEMQPRRRSEISI